MSVTIRKPWVSDHLKDIKLTNDQFAYALQTIRAWASAIHQSDTGAGWGKGYFQEIPQHSTREMTRIQMITDMQHSGLLRKMLMGEEVKESDPRDDPANYNKDKIYLG